MKVLFKLLITAGIFFLIFRHTNIKDALDAAGRADVRYIVLGILAQLMSTSIASFRWFLMMQVLQFGMGFPFYFRSYFKGSFFNQGLPTSIGGDALRVLDVVRKGFRKREAFLGVLIDRVIGLTGLLVLNLMANAALPDLLPAKVFWAINTVTFGGTLAVLSIPWLRRIPFLHGGRWLSLIHGFSERFVAVYRDWRTVVIQLGLSMLTHLFSILAIYCLGVSLGMHYSLVTFLVIVPPVILLTLIPISLAGWGVREGAMIGLFMLVHADHDVVLSMSILYGLTLLVTSLPGLHFYLTGKTRL